MRGYEITASQLSAIQRVLGEEARRARLGPAARISFRLLEVAGYVFPILVALSLSSVFLSVAITERQLEVSDAAYSFVQTARLQLGHLLVPALPALLVLLIVNVPLLQQAYRQWRLSRHLTALRLHDQALRPPRRFPWRSRFAPLVLLAPLGLLLLLFLFSVFSTPDTPAPPGATPAWWQPVVALILLVFLPAALFLLGGLSRRLQVRLEYLEEVLAAQKHVEGSAPAGGGAVLSPEVATSLSEIERTRNFVRRAEDLRRSAAMRVKRYAVSKSDSASATLRGLSAGERVQIEEALEELVDRQRDSLAGTESRSSANLDVPGTPWQVDYRVDHATRTVYVLSIHPPGDAAS